MRSATDDPVVDAKFEELLASTHPEIAEIARAVRAVVRAAFPAGLEYVDLPDRLLGFGISPALRDLQFAIIPHTAYVNLQLADGASLPNPDGLIEGTGKRARHVKIRTVEAARSPAVRAAIDAQLASHGSAER